MNPSAFFYILLIPSIVQAEFFNDVSDLIENNNARLSYGIAVTDFDKDGNNEFIVTGFRYPNLALGLRDGTIQNVLKNPLFSDESRSTIGVAACDTDSDGKEEIYFLNTDTYSGKKLYSDRLLKDGPQLIDIFSLDQNQEQLNLTAGRSVVCVDRVGDGSYDFYVANYGGPTRYYEVSELNVTDKAPDLNIDKITGGRSVVAGHILSEKMDIFAANENGSNFLYKNVAGEFSEVAEELMISDPEQHGRGTVLTDVDYDGNLDIVSGNWNGFHRIFVKSKDGFIDKSSAGFRFPSQIRTVISADFDNDGYDEIFMNNIGQPNRLFKIREHGVLEEIDFQIGLETFGLGTGAAVADIDNDGVLELLIAHGEVDPQPLSLYKAKVKPSSTYLRVQPLNTNGAPARGATVILKTDQRHHAKTIDAGSGYLCQMEPIAHYGLRKKEIVKKVQVRWTDGSMSEIKPGALNTTIVVRQSQ